MPKAKKPGSLAEKSELARIGSEIEPIIQKLPEVLAIEDGESEARASEFLLQIQRRYKLVEDKRKSYVAPIKEQIKVIEADFNKYLYPLKEAIDKTRMALTAWRNSATFKEAEAKRLEIEAKAKEAIRAGDAVAVSELVEAHHEAAIDAPSIVRANSGSVYYRDDLRIEIADASAIPREYLIPDEKAIRAAVKNGAVIPGVKSWVEKIPVSR